MEQLGQLEKELTADLHKRNANVIVIFRKESEGQAGLQKVVDATGTSFLLALDSDSQQTAAYSPGWQVHNSYVINSRGFVSAVLKGTQTNRVQAEELGAALSEADPVFGQD